MKPLSRLTEKFTESVIREMTRVCLAAGGVNLSQGLPDLKPPRKVLTAAVRAIRAGHNQYPITYGEPNLRAAIVRKAKAYNRVTYNPEDEVTVTCGATEAMIASLRALVNAGDEILVFDPYYENYGPDGILSGARPRFISLVPPSWSFDEEAVKAAISPKTKAMIINTPNNPTGKVFSRSELGFLADVCKDNDIYAVTDEIYEHILYDGCRHTSIASLPGMRDRTVTINALSKTYSVTGWRVGWALAEANISRRIRKVHDFLTVGAPTPLQHAGVTALALPASYYRGLAEDYARRRQRMLQLLTDAGFQPHIPKGAYYVMADATNVMEDLGAKDDVSLAHRLVEAVGVASVPGSSFRAKKSDGRYSVRFAFCKTWETLNRVEAAFRRLGTWQGSSTPRGSAPQ